MKLQSFFLLLISQNVLAQVDIGTERISSATSYQAIPSDFATGALIDTDATTSSSTAVAAAGLVSTTSTSTTTPVAGVAAGAQTSTSSTLAAGAAVGNAATTSSSTQIPGATTTTSSSSTDIPVAAVPTTPATTTSSTTSLTPATTTTPTAAAAAGITTTNTFSQSGLASNGLDTASITISSEDDTVNTITLTGAMTSVSIGPGYDSTIGESGSVKGPSANFLSTNLAAADVVYNGVEVGFMMGCFWLMLV